MTATNGSEVNNTIELVSVDESKISNVSLYAGRAEITRIYKLKVKAGQNQVHIKGLPTVLDQQSLRIEGRGAATIHDVTITTMSKPTKTNASEVLANLEAERQRIEHAFERNSNATYSLQKYITTLSAQTVDPAKVMDVLEAFDKAGEKLDDKDVELNKKLEEIDIRISEETAALNARKHEGKLMLKVSVLVSAVQEGEVEIALIYAVSRANWEAAYDIRVEMDAKQVPVTLMYKAVIHQDTGESWDDVPLHLETATPSFGVNLPTLKPWKLSPFRPVTPPPSVGAIDPPAYLPPPIIIQVPSSLEETRSGRTKQTALKRKSVAQPFSVTTPEKDGFPKAMGHASSKVQSKGSVSATFRVPGLVSIPSDGEKHNFTIVELLLDAMMSWVAIPKQDGRVHLKAMIKNASEYTLLAGTASVYVDGSFIARSDVPAVSPQESFDCPLGLDPSIRITYHPLQKTSSTSGFLGRSSHYTFTQRISVHNTKTTPAENIKICDQIPVSEDSQITVKLFSPPLKSEYTASGVAPQPTPPPPPAASLPPPVPNKEDSVTEETSSTVTNGDGGDTLAPLPDVKGKNRASAFFSPGSNASGQTTPGANHHAAFPSEVYVADGVVARWYGADEPDVDVGSLGKDGKLYWVAAVPPGAKCNLSLLWEVTTPLKMEVLGL